MFTRRIMLLYGYIERDIEFLTMFSARRKNLLFEMVKWHMGGLTLALSCDSIHVAIFDF